MIFFYGIEEKPYGCFSNLAPYGVELDGKWWPTVEHYFQSQKFAGTCYEEMIRLTEDPVFVARIGKWKQLPMREEWEALKDEVMQKAVRRKFEFHYTIRQILLSTGDDLIIENAPEDHYWGVGSDGSGKNKLGQILMNVRTILQKGEKGAADVAK
jgi:ribA/ribD-fused uncharacterized protein